MRALILGLVFLVWTTWDTPAAPPGRPARPGVAEIMASTQAKDWRPLDPEQTLYMELPTGRVVVELAPRFAPRHVANIKVLAREHYYDGLSILRVQDNYVTQWGDPNAEKPELARKVKEGQARLPAEFETVCDWRMPFTKLPDGDVYAPEVGFSEGWRVARDRRAGKMWLIHAYGMVGAGRDQSPDSGGGTELYVVIGHAPRHLDRNVTLVGWVVQGMDLLSALPRGHGPMGFYEKAGERLPIKSVRVAADVPEAERVALEVLRTEGPLFHQLLEARRNRREDWFVRPAGRIEIANVPIPVRAAFGSAGKP